MKNHDVIILGGGPGGSTLATYLRQQGIDVAIIEKQIFPRFQIGESLLPCSMDIFRETGFIDVLSNGQYLEKYGAQFIDYRSDKNVFFRFSEGFSPAHSMAYEVPRDQFDQDILKYAISKGTTIYQPQKVGSVLFHKDRVEIETDSESFHTKYFVDASGRTAFLGNQLKLKHPNKGFRNVAVFCHFEGVHRQEGEREGDIVIGVLPNNGWCWSIPFKGKKTSIGVVCGADQFEKNVPLDQHLWKQIQQNALFFESARGAQPISEPRAISNYSHTCESLVGERWILIGDAAIFLDPVFSSGVHLSISSARLASLTLIEALRKGRALNDSHLLNDYSAQVRLGAGRFHSLIRLFYDKDFIKHMCKVLKLKNTRKAFTAAVAGDMWNDQNFLFKMGVL